MLNEGRNECVPTMPITELCQAIGDAILGIPSQAITNAFRHTLLSAPPDGSRDQEYGSKRLLKMIADAPAFEDLPEKYQIPSYTGSGIRRPKVGSEAKYPNRLGTCPKCGWEYSNKYHNDFKTHVENCPVNKIYRTWHPKSRRTLKLLKG